jgi:catechol 2,3-dioxygenase-like lactoylglutathione lyase family enzyme
MAFHHVALATRDVKATHAFYTGPMGFELVKVEVGETPAKGWARHLFYDTGNGELIAFWDLHDDSLPPDWSPAISEGMGLPVWVNHVAFGARDEEDLQARCQRWLDHGLDVLEIDHGWCRSIYATDPNGIMVEFCTLTRALTRADREEAEALLTDPAPARKSPPSTRVHRAGAAPSTDWRPFEA